MEDKLSAGELLEDICNELEDSITNVTVKLKKVDGTTHQTLTVDIKEVTEFLRKHYKDKI